MSDPDLLDWQYDLAGVVIGVGTPVDVIETAGLGWPGVRDSSDTDNPGGDGSFSGPDFLSGRSPQFDAAVRLPGDPAGCHDMVAQLQQAFADQGTRLAGGETFTLRVKRPGRAVKTAGVRLRRLDPTWAQVMNGYVPLDIELFAQDPTWYGDDEQSAVIALGWLSGGGFTAPVQAPIYVTSGTTAQDRPGWVANGGDASAWPVLTVSGPCSGVTITHADSGRTLALPSLVLAAGQSVTLDSRPGRVSVLRETGGNAETYLSASSRLDQFVLPPGQSEIRWTATDPTNTSRLTVTWRDAYTAL